MGHNRVFNFSAGPSALPEAVLEKAATELVNFQNSGMSVMEMSHRSKVYLSIIEETESLLREAMSIPENYSVLFLQGGASTQFAMVPLNILPTGGKAVYMDTGNWSSKAAKEASKYGNVEIAASSKEATYSYIPEIPEIPADAAYYHITTNNTIYGTRYTVLPETGQVPLIADASSDILSAPLDITRFGIYYAGAQKNLGPAGVTVVIIHNDLIGKHREETPTMLQYETHANTKSLYNTPPCYSIYVVGLVLKWLKEQGGVTAIAEKNRRKAAVLYDYIDNSSLFAAPVKKEDRSLMNIPFGLPTDELNKAFISQAEGKGFVNLKGHRSVGGMRASIYNAMPEEGVKKLVDFMQDFERENK